MMTAANALNKWFQQFMLPVYLESDVPDGAELPYITLPLREPEWNKQTSYHFSVWYRTTSNVALLAKADEISGAVGQGVRIPCVGGCLVLWPDTPLVQVMVDGDYRSAYISLILNAYYMPGM